jgi:pyruvate kinase
MQRRTKIVATIGPASDDEATLRAMIAAGMDVARLGLAHGTIDDGLARYHRIRKVAREEGRHLGILVDLPGPKVRAGSFGDGVEFAAGAVVRLAVGDQKSTSDVIEIDYEGLLDDIQVGDRLAVGDGKLFLDITRSTSTSWSQRGTGGIVRPARHPCADPTVSRWPRRPEDFRALGIRRCRRRHGGALVRAFGARRSSRRHRALSPWPAAGRQDRDARCGRQPQRHHRSVRAIMVAAATSATSAPSRLPHLQKKIIRECIALGKPVITATQMLESMVTASSPTRAEASDVANAVWDGSSAVMLSAETAVGVDPVNVIRTMSRIARRADEEFDGAAWAANLAKLRMARSDIREHSITDAMTMAAWRLRRARLAEHRLHLGSASPCGPSPASVPTRILGFSHNPRTIGQLTMSWGTTPILLDTEGTNEEWCVAPQLARRLRAPGDCRGARRHQHLVALDQRPAPRAGAVDQARLPPGVLDRNVRPR